MRRIKTNSRIVPGAEPFFIKGGKVGILLLHGFTSTPQEMWTAGEHFSKKGFTVYAPRLSGHGTNRKDLNRRRYREWIRDAQEGYNRLNKECDQIFIFGSSYGGILSVYTAIHNRVAGVVTIGSPLRLYFPRLFIKLVVPIIKLMTKYVYKPKVGDVRDRKALKRRVANRYIPLNAFTEVWKHVGITEDILPDFDAPLLILQSKRDHAVHPKSARLFYDGVSSRVKELRYFRDSYHLILDDYEKEAALGYIENFMEKVLVTEKEIENEI